MMTSAEQRLAHAMADEYVGRGPDGVEVLGRNAWERRPRGWGSPFDPFSRGYAPRMRRFTIHRTPDGRVVIQSID
jgi:hypothetical protein